VELDIGKRVKLRDVGSRLPPLAGPSLTLQAASPEALTKVSEALVSHRLRSPRCPIESYSVPSILRFLIRGTPFINKHSFRNNKDNYLTHNYLEAYLLDFYDK